VLEGTGDFNAEFTENTEKKEEKSGRKLNAETRRSPRSAEKKMARQARLSHLRLVAPASLPALRLRSGRLGARKIR
jgi:hypothetical protein